MHFDCFLTIFFHGEGFIKLSIATTIEWSAGTSTVDTLTHMTFFQKKQQQLWGRKFEFKPEVDLL